MTTNPAQTVEALIEEYARRYSAHDVDGVVALCHWPFLAIREGAAIHLADETELSEHFASIMGSYRSAGAALWSPVELEPHALGESVSFVTVRWQARDENGTVLHDRRTTYHVLNGPDGWRFLSYTNHF